MGTWASKMVYMYENTLKIKDVLIYEGYYMCESFIDPNIKNFSSLVKFLSFFPNLGSLQ